MNQLPIKPPNHDIAVNKETIQLPGAKKKKKNRNRKSEKSYRLKRSRQSTQVDMIGNSTIGKEIGRREFGCFGPLSATTTPRHQVLPTTTPSSAFKEFVLSHGWLHPTPPAQDSATEGYSTAAKGGLAGVLVMLLTIVVYVFFKRRNCTVRFEVDVEMPEISVHAGGGR
ncbi:hypothetical protein NC652_029118 [Populus alba x Populus x berolinensis]|nr:hypothetical protein NC652_029118 [Populus alba x Populus x berolinensis]